MGTKTGSSQDMNAGFTLLWRKIWSSRVLCEAGKIFTRLEAWLYLANVLAAGKDDEAAGIKRGEFIASVRQLSKCFNWSHGTAQRFIDLLLANSMISRVVCESVHLPIRDAGHFIVCNYDTYNPVRYADQYARRYTKRYNLKEVFKETTREVVKDTHQPADAGVCVAENPRRNLPAIQPGAARGEGTYG